MLKKISLFMVLIMSVFAFAGCNGEKSKTVKEELSPEEKYNKAVECIASGDYYSALDIIIELDDYKDCKDLKENFVFVCTNEKDSTGTEFKYEYDGLGKKLTREQLSYDSTVGNTTYYYNEKSQCIKEVTKNKGGELIYEHAYNEEGYLISTYSNNGIVDKTEYEYDAIGNCVKERNILSGSQKEVVDIHTYDDKGNIIKTENSTGLIYTFEFTYNDDGFVEKEILYWNGEKSQTILYTYDKYGNKIKEKYEANSIERTYKYALLYIVK